MSDRNNFDTLDILAGAIGVAFAFIVLPFPADRGTERIVVGISVLLMVAIKCRPQAAHVVPVIMHPHITSEWPANQLVAA